MNTSNNNLAFTDSKLYLWLNTKAGKVASHAVFWLLFLMYLSIEGIVSGGIEDNCTSCFLLDNLVYLFTTMCAVYVNTLVLVTRFLYKKQFLKYIIGLFSLILITSGLKVYIFNVILKAGDVEEFGLLATSFLWFFGDLFEVSAISSIKIFFDWVYTKNKLQQKENSELEAEFRFLKAQVNPHFIFNTLNNIYFLINKNSPKAGEAIISLSNILRYRIYDRNETNSTIENEIECIKELIELEKLRNDPSMQIELQIEGHYHKHKMEPLLFIPFIENAFKHCKPVEHKKNISIKFNLNEHDIAFYCSNSYIQELGQKDLLSSGVGIKNVTNRLKLLYPNKHQLSITQDKNTYTVSLHIKI